MAHIEKLVWLWHQTPPLVSHNRFDSQAIWLNWHYISILLRSEAEQECVYVNLKGDSSWTQNATHLRRWASQDSTFLASKQCRPCQWHQPPPTRSVRRRRNTIWSCRHDRTSSGTDCASRQQRSRPACWRRRRCWTDCLCHTQTRARGRGGELWNMCATRRSTLTWRHGVRFACVRRRINVNAYNAAQHIGHVLAFVVKIIRSTTYEWKDFFFVNFRKIINFI